MDKRLLAVTLSLLLLLAGLPAAHGEPPTAASERAPAVVEWGPDGKVLIAVNGLLARFDLDTEKEELLDDTVLAFALSPDGTRLAVAGPEEVSLRSYSDFTWQGTLALPEPVAGRPEAGKPETSQPELRAVQALAWSPAPLMAGHDARTLAGGTASGHVLLWEIGAQAPAASELWADLGIEPASAVARLTFSADGKRLLAAFEDGRAVLWDLEQRQELARFGPARPGPPRSVQEKFAAGGTSMVLSPDGRRVLVTQAWGGQAEMSLLEESGEVVWRRAGLGVEFTGDGSGVLALVPPFRLAALYRVEDAGAVRVFEPPEGVKTLHAVRLNADGTRLVAVGEDYERQVLIVWDFASGRVVKTRR